MKERYAMYNPIYKKPLFYAGHIYHLGTQTKLVIYKCRESDIYYIYNHYLGGWNKHEYLSTDDALLLFFGEESYYHGDVTLKKYLRPAQ